MTQTTQEILNDFFDEAQSGTVFLATTGKYGSSPWKFNIELFANIEGNSNALHTEAPVVQIPNYQRFVEVVDRYLSIAEPFYIADKEYFDLTDSSYQKKLIADLFASATNFDFHDVFTYINHRTRLLKNPLPTQSFEIGTLNGTTIIATIKKNQSQLEGPYNMEFVAQHKNETYQLPSVTFAIDEDKLYIYAIKYFNKKSKDPITHKEINSVADGKLVLDTEFKEKMNSYFHTITQNSHSKGVERNVSPTSLVSFAMFLSLFKSSEIKEIIAPNFMPIRYATNKQKLITKSYTEPELLESLLKKHDNDQNNITNKFMYLFLRYNRNFPENEIEYDDLRQEMRMTLSPTQTFGENLIYQIDQMGHDQITLSK